jgi:predicted lipoprotein with Yx(FWY)xxD motif
MKLTRSAATAATLAALTPIGAVLTTAALATPSAIAAGGQTVSAVTSRGHTILVDRNGLALYLFTRDRGAHNSCIKISGCSAVWPSLTTAARPTAGPNVNARLLGTITVGHRLQVTYAGHPLYEYAQKSFPGFTSYIGTPEFGGAWDAVSPSGRAVK